MNESTPDRQDLSQEPAPDEVTQLLRKIAQGHSCGGDEGALYEIIKTNFRAISRRLLDGQHPERKPRETELMDTVFMKLVRDRRTDWKDQNHFYRTAAREMRRALINHYRKLDAIKRGGNCKRIPLSGDALLDAKSIDPCQIVELSDLLDTLYETNPTAMEALELWVFGKLTKKEIAELMSCTLSQTETLIDLAKTLVERFVREST